MALTFITRRHAPTSTARDVASRVAAPLSVADVLGAAGTQNAKDLARADKRSRDMRAVLPHPALSASQSAALSEAEHLNSRVINPTTQPADPRLIAKFGADLCLKHRVLPWRETAGRIIVLAASQQDFVKVRDALTVIFGPVHLAIVTADDLDRTLTRMCHKALMHTAEHRTADVESCRDWDAGKAMRWGGLTLTVVLACLYLWPTISFFVLCGWAVFTLFLNTLLKIAAVVMHLRSKDKAYAVDPNVPDEDLPIVTILVPLFRERDIAHTLVQRLSQLDYPSERLDVCIVLEADDATTRDTLAVTTLPAWMRAIHVPLGTLQTKPRALNYALNFAKGSIVGVYDAEDAPAPDQIRTVANRFAAAGPEVACLQGRLDYYNSTSNWLARCFTIEYATWFGIMLPGLQRLNLAIPLGGTTLFFRRDVLEDLGGWDAHNVTEDADLGIRLVRHGYCTEIIDTVTQEEANARAWPWVKQRSRWLKGYAITYGVHMRNPAKLWRDVGAWKFFGIQLLFGGTLTQFLLAPLLWSFWLMMFGLPHPLSDIFTGPIAWTFAGLFFLCEIVGITVSAIAVKSISKGNLIPWTPTLHVYFPLAAIAAYKGILELATKPFYWDKTSHGIFAPTVSAEPEAAPSAPLQPLPHPIAAE